MKFLNLAWRNVRRHRRRTIITIAAISVGLAALTFLWAFIDGANHQMIDNTTRYFAGDLQVHSRGYHDDPSFDRLMPDAADVLTRVRSSGDVIAASPRLEGKALASSGEQSRGVTLAGIDVDSEQRVTSLGTAVVKGRSLTPEERGVLVGEQLADALGIKLGDDLVLLGQGADGSIASDRLPVRGIFRTKIDDLDGWIVVTTLATARDFYSAPDGVTGVAARLADRERLALVSAALARTIGRDHEVIGWQVLLPMVAVSVRYHEVTGFVVLLIFFVLVAASVVNPVLVGVLERTREFGMLLGLGMSPVRLLRLVLYEAALLGIAGVIIGNALGIAVTAYFARRGIDLGAFEAGLRTMPGLADVIYPTLRLSRSIPISLLVFVTSCLAALYPALKAARLDPVEAMRGGSKGRVFTLLRGGVASARIPVFALIAARNVLRNPRRTAITVGGTAFAIAAFVFLFGYYDGFGEQIVDTSTRYLTGHIQIEQRGFRDNYSAERSIGDAGPILQQVRRLPGVVAAPRVQAQALVSTATKSKGILLIGVDPDAERGVTFIHQAVRVGKYLQRGSTGDIVIGSKLSRDLQLTIGDRIVVTTQSKDGEIATAAYRIQGIFQTESSAYDGTIAFITLDAAQRLIGLGSGVSTINLRLADSSALDSTTHHLEAGVLSGDLVAARWQDLLPQIDEMVRVIRVFRAVVLTIIFLIVALAVMNTVYMAVTERTREFGIMLALGTAPGEVVRLVLYETSFLMIISLAIGYAVGAAIVVYFGSHGIDLSAFFKDYSAIPGLTGVAHPLLIVSNIVLPGALLFAASIIVSLLPARHAAALDPAVAFRHA